MSKSKVGWPLARTKSTKLSAFVSDRPKIICRHCVDASRQIRWSPNFSHTIDSDAIRKWGQRSSLAPFHRNLGRGASALPVP